MDAYELACLINEDEFAAASTPEELAAASRHRHEIDQER